MDKDLQNKLFNYTWNYFSLHAEQRLKTFHFFIIISTFIVGCILTIVKDLNNFIYAIPLAFLLSILSFVFWKLDLRNKELIKNGENSLKILESYFDLSDSNAGPNMLRLFCYEEWKTNKKSKYPSVSLFKTHLSYSDCFNIVFFCYGFSGFVVGCLLIVRLIYSIALSPI